MLSGLRFFGTEPDDNIRGALGDLGRTRVADMAGTKRHVATISRGLWSRYVHRYFIRGGSFMPIFHAAFGIGLLGYVWEYSHLKHQRDHPEGH